MSAAKANNNRDTYKATAITLIVFGILYLVDKLVHFSAIGLPWVMNKDNFLLYTAVIFLLFKHDKSVGLVLIGLLADIELRIDNGFARYDVGLSVATGIAGIRGYSVLVGNKISVWREEV